MTETFQIAALDAAHLATAVSQTLPRLAVGLRPDVTAALQAALGQETEARAQRVLSMLLENAAIAQSERVPLCQDTGTVWLLLEVGMDSAGRPISVPSDIFSQVDASVRWVWRERSLRNSLVRDAILDRSNTTDNTPAICELAMRPDLQGARLSLLLKGGGSDNASALAMLNPSDGWPQINRLVTEQVMLKGANACPPLIIGLGIGSSFDKVASLSKQALLRPLDEANPDKQLAEWEAELLADINSLGIGPGGLGGKTTALGVRIVSAACHMASLPVAVNIGCSAMRSLCLDLAGEWL
ncbi:MAG: fumarate hydratase [Coriobacteriia bacterium]|nr:fumarate hydratase [Coriobacteriia bacterium]